MGLKKLRPDRDLQCYFERPSAIAALSGASATGFTISGSWRQQFDWAVLEWNRDNVFEHPAFRNLPDGDLSGLELTYEEVRTNCMPMDSDLYPTVEWPYLRIWIEGAAIPRLVRLRDYASPVEGDYIAATAELELQGTPTGGDYIGVAWGAEQYNYWVAGWGHDRDRGGWARGCDQCRVNERAGGVLGIAVNLDGDGGGSELEPGRRVRVRIRSSDRKLGPVACAVQRRGFASEVARAS